MPSTKSELQHHIRFALAQLSSRNEHHRFEDLAREFALRRIASNILPATGPVAAGGDQGRDFETFRSYIRHSPIANSTFVALVSERKAVFACSIQKDIEPKIKEDVKTITGSGEQIDLIYYFCEADLPVGKRHALQAWALSEHHVEIEILDGRALSEQLTDSDVWWIAQEYLSIPADVFPREFADEGRYATLRKRWIDDTREPFTFADFVEIDAGLRRAMYEKACRADLLPWLAKSREFLREGCPERMRRKVQYEVAVVSLRGLNNLSAEYQLVAEFFDTLHGGLSPAQLQDATILLTYCAAAAREGHFDVDSARLIDWASRVTKLLDEAIDRSPGKNSLCELLLSRAQACIFPVAGGAELPPNPDQMFNYWRRLLDIVSDAPLFPLEQFADILTKMTPVLADDPSFSGITERVDQLLEQRSSGFVAAEKCLDRAMVLYNGDHFVKALQQLQRAKLRWFAAETLPKAVLAMLLAADCYERLKLFYAAKYYAAGVVCLLFRQENQNLKRVLSRAAFHLCGTCYASGASISYMETLHLALLLQQNFVPDPFYFDKHVYLRNQIAQAAILRAVSRRLAPDLLPVVDQLGGGWELSDDLWAIVTELSREGAEPWHSMPSDEIWRRIQTEIGAPIFSELGMHRTIRWPALGITWAISFANTYDLTLLGEELAATLQIIQADLATVDMCLLPTTADIELSLTEEDVAAFEELPDNDRACWLIKMPTRLLERPGDNSNQVPDALPLAVTILGQCTTLSRDKFEAVLKSAFRAGLSTKAFSVRAAHELFAQVHSREIFESINRAALSPPRPPAWFEIAPAAELRWRDGPGPGYSREKAEAFIRNRYDNAVRPIRLTLPRLMSDSRVRSAIKKMQEEGLPDWQILNIIASMVTNFRVRQDGDPHDPNLMQETFQKWLFRDEQPDAPVFPAESFLRELELAKNVAFLSNLQTWGLVQNLRTPNLIAIKRFLDVRYRNSSDDIPHESYFPDPD